MFEPGRDQAAGLRQLFAPSHLLMLPLACGFGDEAEREAVDLLVRALERIGRRPMVVDMLESPARSQRAQRTVGGSDLPAGVLSGRAGGEEFGEFLRWMHDLSAQEGEFHDLALVAAEPLQLADLTAGLCDRMLLLTRDGDRGVARAYSQIKALRMAHGLARYQAAFVEPRSRASATAAHRRLADTAALFLGASIEYGGAIGAQSDRSSWDRFAEVATGWTSRVLCPMIDNRTPGDSDGARRH